MGGAANLCSWCAPIRGFRCGRPAGVSGVGPQSANLRACNRASGELGGCLSGFTFQGLREEGRQRPRLLRRVLYLAAECLYFLFLFLFEKFFLFKPPWSKEAPGCSHSSAWLSPKNPAVAPAPGPGLQPPWFPHRSQGPYCPSALFLPSDLSMSSIFGLRSSYMLEYRWLFALLLRSARYFTGVEGKWALLPPISPPSSLNVLNFFLIIYYLYIKCD